MDEKTFRAEIRQIIDGAKPEHRQRLRGLQAKCDMIRRAYGTNHLGCAIEMSKLMKKSLIELNDALHGRIYELDSSKEAKVLPFTAKDKDE